MKKIELAHNSMDDYEIKKLTDWLSQKPTPQLTHGPKCEELEVEFAKKMNSKHAKFVNSGSSAILLMLYALIVAKKLKNRKILVNSLAWCTDVSSPMALGLEPILIDCNLNDLSVDYDHLKEMIEKEKPSVLLLVSILGLPPEMDKIVKLCKENDVLLLEDCCESLLSSYDKKLLGTFGLMSCFSFFWSHHITSVEGGMILTNDDDINEILTMLRAHGWSRSLSAESKKKYRDKYNVSEFDEMYTFYYPGLNFRNTSINSFIALGQLEKLDDFVKIRNDNYLLFQNLLKNDYWKPNVSDKCFVSNMAYPIIHPKKKDIIKVLNENNIECRPLVSGSMSYKQPFYTDVYGKKELPNVKIVDDFGIYIPNNQGISSEDVEYMCNIINSVINK